MVVSLVKHLSRDQLAALIGVKHSTMGVWRHRGLISPPSKPGTTGHQSEFDADRTFEIFCFALAAADPSIRLDDAATVTRYLFARPGTLSLLTSFWHEPVVLKICPAFDIAAFAPPSDLLYDTVTRAHEVLQERHVELRSHGTGPRMHESNIVSQVAEELPVEYLLSRMQLGDGGAFDDDAVQAMRELEERSAPEQALRTSRGTLAGRIFRNQKAIQYGDVARHYRYHGHLDQLDLSQMTLEQVLLAEGWALAFLDDVLYANGLKGRYAASETPVYSVDVSPAVRGTAEAFSIETHPPRDYKNPPSELNV